MSLNKLEIIRGDDTNLEVSFTDENDVAVDISNDNLVFTAKSDFTSSGVISVSVASGEHSDPTNGKTNILLSHDDTDIDAGNYFYDIQLTSGSGYVRSIDYGRLIVKHDITN